MTGVGPGPQVKPVPSLPTPVPLTRYVPAGRDSEKPRVPLVGARQWRPDASTAVTVPAIAMSATAWGGPPIARTLPVILPSRSRGALEDEGFGSVVVDGWEVGCPLPVHATQTMVTVASTLTKPCGEAFRTMSSTTYSSDHPTRIARNTDCLDRGRLRVQAE
jgi:hypothetical protein